VNVKETYSHTETQITQRSKDFSVFNCKLKVVNCKLKIEKQNRKRIHRILKKNAI